MFISGCSSFSEVRLRESDYAAKRAAPAQALRTLPGKIEALLPAEARAAHTSLEPFAGAPRSNARVLVSFRAGSAGKPVHVRIECEPTAGGLLRCVTVQRSFGPLRDEVRHALYAWGGLLEVAQFDADPKAPLALKTHVSDVKLRSGTALSGDMGALLFDALLTIKGGQSEQRLRRVCYRRAQGRARVPAQLASYGPVQQLECRADLIAVGQAATVTLFQGNEFTGPVFYLPDHGIALPVWMFYSSDAMTNAGFYTDPGVLMSAITGPRRDLVVRIEPAGSGGTEAAQQTTSR